MIDSTLFKRSTMHFSRVLLDTFQTFYYALFRKHAFIGINAEYSRVSEKIAAIRIFRISAANRISILTVREQIGTFVNEMFPISLISAAIRIPDLPGSVIIKS